MYIDAPTREEGWRETDDHNHIVLTAEGLKSVLHDRAFEAKLAAFPGSEYTITCQEGLVIDIDSQDPIWWACIDVIRWGYVLEALPVGSTAYVLWINAADLDGRSRLVGLRITKRSAA